MADVQLARRNVDELCKFGRLTGKQKRGIALICSGFAMVEVARRVGVNRSTDQLSNHEGR
jgi:hypothetical protein